MQKMYRYLANNKVTVLANTAGFATEYRPVYQKNLLVYRGIDNLIHFEVKNHDQKPVSLSGYDPVFLAYDENNNLVLEKKGDGVVTKLDDITTKSTVVAESVPDYNLEFTSTSGVAVGQIVTGTYIPRNTLVTAVTDNVVTINKKPTDTIPLGTEITFQTMSKKGVFTVNITDNDLIDLKQQYLKYVVYLVASDGQKTLTYSSDHFDAKGTMYVDGMAFPGPLATYSVTGFSEDESASLWYTESIDAQPALNGNSALHTAAVYTDGFAGTFTVEATLDNQPSLNTFWANVGSLVLDGTETEPTPINFNGVYSHIRFKVDADPTDLISKVLVRN